MKMTLQSQQIHGVTWHYYDSQQGKTTIVILLNMLMMPEEWEWYIQRLTKKYRVVIPMYPVGLSLENIAQGLQVLSEQVHIKQRIILGNSFGGVIAQVYAAMYPENSNNIILLTTIGPQKVFGMMAFVLYAVAFLLPSAVITWFVYLAALLSMTKETRMTWAGKIKNHLWKVHTKPVVLSLAASVISFCLSQKNAYHISSQIPVTIIESRWDLVFSLPFQNLKKLYPHAKYTRLPSGKHLAELNQKKLLISLLLEV